VLLFDWKNKKSNGCFRHRDVLQYKVWNPKNSAFGFDCKFQPSSVFGVVARLLFGKEGGKEQEIESKLSALFLDLIGNKSKCSN
jgi:hypothetical protein